MSIDYTPVTGSLGAQCPCCDGDDRIGYSIITDEYTCCACGLVGSVAEFHGRFAEMHPAGEADAAQRSIDIIAEREAGTSTPAPVLADSERAPEVWASIASFAGSYCKRGEAHDGDTTGSPVRPRLGGSTTPV